jgi:polyribonucleotide nucleotidyltransferase
MLIEYNILNKKISLNINNNSNFSNSFTLTINNIVIYGAIVINNNLNTNTNLTVFYKEAPYSSGIFNKKNFNKSDKETRISRQIDRSLRPFLIKIKKEININIILLQNPYNKDPIEEILLTGFLLNHISGFIKEENLYGENIQINEKNKKNLNIILTANNKGIVMLEGYFNKITKEELFVYVNCFIENQKIFKEFYEFINKEIGEKFYFFYEKKTEEQLNLTNLKKRIDGRKWLEIRPINISLNPLKINSCIFQRGETKVLVVCNIQESEYNEFSLQYKFHPFSVEGMGETFGNSRREKGHSFLGQNSLKYLTHKGLSYEVISEVLICNGSSSMATVCGGSLCFYLFSGGELVSGITSGIIGNNICLDLSGEEDQISKCDLKIVSNKNNEILSIFMDTKETINLELLNKLITNGLKGNNKILKIMKESLKDLDKTSFFLKKEKISFFNYKENIINLEKIFNVKITTYKNGIVIIDHKNIHKKNLDYLVEIIKSYDSLTHGKKVICVVGTIKEVNNKTVIHLGGFNYIIDNPKDFKYKTGDIISGIINNNNNQSKFIILESIKKIKLK